MNRKICQKLTAIGSTVVFGFLLFKLFERTFVIIWVNTPWWGALLMLVVLFLLIGYLMGRVLGVRD